MEALLEVAEQPCYEFIPSTLYFCATDKDLSQVPQDVFLFTFDGKLIYEGFCLDYGPLNMANTYAACQIIHSYLDDKRLQGKPIVLVAKTEPKGRNNAITLICAYMILMRNQTADQAFEPVKQISSTFPFFHDASYFNDSFGLSVLDCLRGLYAAYRTKLFSWPDFDIEDYQKYCDLKHGDLNWIAEGMFCAFAGPFDKKQHFGNGYYSTVPTDYIPYFKEKNVTLIIRLNKRRYNEQVFLDAGINHIDLFYPDGLNPPSNIIAEFLRVTEQEIFVNKGAVAVHCKAGLGRTGTCIGMFLMKHYGFTAREVIGWMRFVRPGSVIGPQQNYLEQNESRMHVAGRLYRERNENGIEQSSRRQVRVSLTGSVKSEQDDGLETQGDKLNANKARNKVKVKKERQE